MINDLEFFEILLNDLKWSHIMNYPEEEFDYRLKLDELNKAIKQLRNKSF